MKTITFKFNDGTTSTVEVTEEIYAEYMRMEREEKNINRAETRRHVSLDLLQESGMDFPSNEPFNYSEDPFDSIENEDLYDAVKSLLPEQQELIRKIFFEGMKIVEIAKAENTTQNAISLRLDRILTQLRKKL